MPKTQGQSKNLRILSLYDRFNQGEILVKNKLADEFHVDKRSIQRDIKDLNDFLAEQGDHKEILYNKDKKGYELKKRNGVAFADREIFAICLCIPENWKRSPSNSGGILWKPFLIAWSRQKLLTRKMVKQSLRLRSMETVSNDGC